MNPLSLELGIHLGVRRDANMCLRRQTEVDTLTECLDRVMIVWDLPCLIVRPMPFPSRNSLLRR